MKKMLIAGAAALCVLSAGCTDLKPLQSQIDDLKSQVAKDQAAHAGMQAGIDSAAKAAQAAMAAAMKAQSTADAAMALAQDDKARIDGLDAKLTEKITKAFKKSHEK